MTSSHTASMLALCVTALGLLGGHACPTADGSDMIDVDLGLFARVVTSDPARMDGARCGRLEEFPAEDVFLTTELVPDPDGNFVIPSDGQTGGAIGLEWAERRVLRRLTLEPVTSPAAAITPIVEYWSSSGREDSWGSIGQTPWQGRWETVPAKVEFGDGRWSVAIPLDAIPELRSGVGVLKVRWRFPPGAGGLIVKRPQALGTATWQIDRLQLSTEIPGDLTVTVYNGLLVDDAQHRSLTQAGNTCVPLELTVLGSQPSAGRADRTLLRCRLSTGAATVAVQDVVSAGQVFVRDLGLLACRSDVPIEPASYRVKVAGDQTILARVRDMPDQSLAQAMRALWQPVQNNGPTMLSLACDNAKFIVERDGVLRYGSFALRPQFPPKPITVARLDFGLPGIDTTVRPSESVDALPLRIGQRTYSKGLGLHANAEVCVSLDGRFDLFAAEVGVLPCGQPGGTAICQVDVDGQRRFDGRLMRQGEAPQSLRVSVAGAHRLVLRVTDAGDGILNDAVNWAEARLCPRGADDEHGVYLSDLYRTQESQPATRRRTLDGRWLPIVLNTHQSGNLVLHQRAFVAPAEDIEAGWDRVGRTRSVGVAEFTLDNTSDSPGEVTFRLDAALAAGNTDGPPLRVSKSGNQIVWSQADRLLAALDVSRADPLDVTSDERGVLITGCLSLGQSSQIVAYVPAWSVDANARVTFVPAEELALRVSDYWRAMTGGAMQVKLPEPFLEDLYLATQVHCLMAARSEADGQRVAPWIASDAYGPLDSEAQAVILGLDVVGQQEFARRALDFFIASYSADGLLTKGYTLMGTGQHLWTLAAHHRLSRDRAWLTRVAPEILKSCGWIVRQTEKTKRFDAQGERLLEFGLAPPGVLADWERYAYYFYANAQYCAGVTDAADVLAEIMPREAAELRRAAAEYHAHLLRAFHAQRSLMPVVPLRDGTWVAPCPSSLYCYGQTRDFFGGISAIGHDVEVGGNHLIPLQLLPADSPEADAIVDYLEDRWFLIDGIFGAYPAGENEEDWFNRGGFSKLQPHYTRTADLHALRDDVRPFIRTYFNSLPVLLNRENLTFWEHMNNGGAWNKTHESAWFLQMTRNMLLMERGDQLWLAPFVTTHWMHDGMEVSVDRAPTRFGAAGYTLRSFVNAGHIDATIQPPTQLPPRAIVLRVRHPGEKRIRSVMVDGKTHTDFDPAADVIRIAPSAQPISVRVEY